MKEKWMVKNKSADFKAIAANFNITEVTARLLINRGLQNFGEMEAYLHPDLSQLNAPETLKDAEKTAQILKEKIAESKKIRIIGDYDVDGVVATYIFMEALSDCGARVDFRIPERIRDGYGLNLRLVEEASEDGVDTILTCDNGIAAVEQVAFAKKCGMTVLITDHHELQEQLPEADTIVNPKQKDCTYPYKGLCGAAVAYKVAKLLYKVCEKSEETAEKFIAFAAIATVCDVMELTGENRSIVSLGIAALRKSQHCGIRALCEANSIEIEELDTYRLGFVLGPCINATGRLQTAVRGVELLLEENKEEAAAIALELKKLNDIRKELTAKGVQEAIEIVEKKGALDKVLVVFLPDCHESLAGIIAGRLRERYNRPAIVLTKAENGLKGSGRSIEQYSMFEKLTEWKELLTKYGGHPMAAGLSLAEENYLPLAQKLNESCGLTEEDLTLKISIDAVLALSGLSFSLVKELLRLEPFGKGNEKPVFAERGLKLLQMTAIGKERKMFRFLVEDAYGTQMDALYFGDGEKLEEEMLARYGEVTVRSLYCGKDTKVRISVIYYPSINEYRNMQKLQIVIQHIQWM